jgi:hypothetical protein
MFCAPLAFWTYHHENPKKTVGIEPVVGAVFNKQVYEF